MFFTKAFILFVLLCSAVHNKSIAQNAQLDSLKKLYDKAKDDSSRMDLLVQLSKGSEYVDTSLSWQYYRQAKEIAERSGREIFTGYTNELAGILYTRSDKKLALEHYNKAIGILQRQLQTPRVKNSLSSINNNLGVIHYMGGDYEGALNYFLQSIQYYEQNDPLNMNLGLGYGNVATTYADLKKPEMALQYSSKSMAFAIRSGNKSLLMSAYISHGNNLLKLKRYHAALPYLRQARLLAEELKNKYNLYLYYTNITEYFFMEEKYDSALHYSRLGLPYARALNSPYELGFTIYGMGSCLLKLGDYSNARILLDSSLAIANTNDIRDLERYSMEALSELSALTGRYDKAFEYTKRATVIKDSLYAADNIRRIEFLDAKYQGEKKQKDLVQLQKDKELHLLAIQKKTNLNYFLFSFIALLLIAIVVGFRNIRHRQQLSKQANLLQEQKIRELEKDKQLVAVDSMLKGQEEERARMAKDLHDGLGGMLSGVKFSLMNMKSNLIINHENVIMFERSLDMLETSIQELRRVAHNMMPEALSKYGLDDALRDYCNNINNSQIVHVNYQSFGMNNRLENSTEIIIYRIIQELFANILKHAKATEVLVQLVREGERLSITVEDNGKGFEIKDLEKGKGAGWSNIRSRVDYLKGKLDLNSGPVEGTSVNIEFHV